MDPLLARVQASGDLQVGLELKLGDSVEALFEMRLDTQGVLCLGQDFQQLVVRQEVEPWESLSGIDIVRCVSPRDGTKRRRTRFTMAITCS